MSAPPPIPPKKTLFHDLKRTIFSGGDANKTVDTSFDEHNAEFERFLALAHRLAAEVKLTGERFSQLCQTTTSVWEIQNEIFAGNSSHANADMISIAHATHEKCNSNYLPPARDALSAATESIGALLRECDIIKDSVKARAEALTEYDYYQNKVAELDKEKDKAVQAGKSYKNQEKLDRNHEKLRESRLRYEGQHESTLQLMVALLAVRHDRVAPVAAAVLRAEMGFAQGYKSCLEAVREPQSESINDFLGASEPSPPGGYEASRRPSQQLPPPPPAAATSRPLPPPPAARPAAAPPAYGQAPEETNEFAVPVMAVPRYG